MKTAWKLLTVPLVAATMLLALPNSSRADHGRYDNPRRDNNNAAVAIVAGIAAVGVIAAIASHHDRDRHVARAYCAPPPPPPPRHWVPGHYETRRERVCIPGYWQTVTEPVRHPHGRGWGHHQVRYVPRQVWVPERFEWRETQVWVPGHHVMARRY